MKSKTQDKKRLNAVGMRICALFAVLAVVFAAFMTTVPHALASETGNPASVKGKTYKIGTDTTFAPFEYRENGKMTGIDMELIRGIAKEEGFKRDTVAGIQRRVAGPKLQPGGRRHSRHVHH